jgi:hypothetical protein
MSVWLPFLFAVLFWGAAVVLNFLARVQERRVRDGLVSVALFCLVGPVVLARLGYFASRLPWPAVVLVVAVLSFVASFVSLGLRHAAVARVLLGLQTIDRRIIYVAVAVLIFLPLVLPFELPMYITPAARSFYETVEKVPLDKLVIVACDYGAGTRGENEPQTRGVIEHLMKKGQRFAILGFELQGPEFAQRLAEKAEKKYKRTYGRDWCNWGYKPSIVMTLMSLAKNIPDTIKEDRDGTPLRNLEVMKGIETIRDVGMICEFTGSGMLPYYVQFIQGVYGTPLGQGCTGIIGPEQFPYLDSGQLKGSLIGMKGAAEYETLVGYRGKGFKAMIPQSIAHILLMVLIVLGNIGLYVAQRRGR